MGEGYITVLGLCMIHCVAQAIERQRQHEEALRAMQSFRLQQKQRVEQTHDAVNRAEYIRKYFQGAFRPLSSIGSLLHSDLACEDLEDGGEYDDWRTTPAGM